MKSSIIISSLLILFYKFSLSTSLKCDQNSNKVFKGEEKLRRHLLCNYDVNDRPVNDFNQQVVVNISAGISNYEFVEKTQKFFVNMQLHMRWRDDFLQWDHNEFDSIKEIFIPSNELWKPDLKSYSSYSSENFDTTCSSPKCIVNYHGFVNCTPSCHLKSYCNSDFTNFPVDVTSCTLEFGTWMESEKEVAFNFFEPILALNGLEQHSAQWKIIENDSYVLQYQVKQDNLSMICFDFILKRHTGIYSANIYTPALIMIMVNLLACWINNTQRLVLLGSNIFVHVYWIKHMFYAIPFNGETVPLIFEYFRNSLISTLFLFILMIYLRYKGNYQEVVQDILARKRNIFPRKSVDDAENLVDEDTEVVPGKIIDTCCPNTLNYVDLLIFIFTIIVYTVNIVVYVP